MLTLFYCPTAHGPFSSTDGALFMYHKDWGQYRYPIPLFAMERNLMSTDDYYVIDKRSVIGEMCRQQDERQRDVYQQFITAFYEGRDLTGPQKSLYADFCHHIPFERKLIPFSNPYKDSMTMIAAASQKVYGDPLSEQECRKFATLYMNAITRNVFEYLPGISFTPNPSPRIFL